MAMFVRDFAVDRGFRGRAAGADRSRGATGMSNDRGMTFGSA
jgi:hypothetical protein